MVVIAQVIFLPVVVNVDRVLATRHLLAAVLKTVQIHVSVSSGMHVHHRIRSVVAMGRFVQDKIDLSVLAKLLLYGYQE